MKYSIIISLYYYILQKRYFTCRLFVLDPMTLIYERDLDILKMLPLTENEASRSRLSEIAARTGQTDRQPDRRDQTYLHSGIRGHCSNTKLISTRETRTALYFLPLLRLTPRRSGFPWDDLRKILHGDQRIAKVHNDDHIWSGRDLDLSPFNLTLPSFAEASTTQLIQFKLSSCNVLWWPNGLQKVDFGPYPNFDLLTTKSNQFILVLIWWNSIKRYLRCPVHKLTNFNHVTTHGRTDRRKSKTGFPPAPF